MNITGFVETNRQKALLEGDYNAYRRHLTRKCQAARRKLGISTPKGTKYVAKGQLTSADVGKNNEYVHLLLLNAERAWADAWSFKVNRPETQDSTGHTRRHIISRFHKAASYAHKLSNVLGEQPSSGASDLDILEAHAYAACLIGAQELNKQAGQRFEDSSLKKQAWQPCLASFSAAFIIYASLFKLTENVVFKDFSESEVEQNIRYAAYQHGLPRTRPIPAIARDYFPRINSNLVQLIEVVDPDALRDNLAVSTESYIPSDEIPTTITWRSHTSPIVDASIGQALAATALAEKSLLALFVEMAQLPQSSITSLAALYDSVLTACQDTVDVTRRSIAELTREGVTESDQRMQHLRVADLAVNYTLVDWRAGRNRVLVSGVSMDDGASFELEPATTPSRQRKDGRVWIPKPETGKHILARLQQRTVLYDATLQSIDSIKTLRGANRDEKFVEELEGKARYFQALKCLNIGFSYELMGQHPNALSLYSRAEQLMKTSASFLAGSLTDAHSQSSLKPPTLAISRPQFENLWDRIGLQVTRHRGLVALEGFSSDVGAPTGAQGDISGRLHEYPSLGTVDVRNLVTFPPKLEPVPVKPIFLDLAWNYIAYPGTGKRQALDGANGKPGMGPKKEHVADEKAEDTGRRGWFGFGRR